MSQSVFVAEAPVVIPTFTEDRGNIWFDPVTKSTWTKVVKYDETNSCGETAWTYAQCAATINKLVNCVPTMAAQVTIKVRIPVDGDGVDEELIINFVKSKLDAAFPGGTP